MTGGIHGGPARDMPVEQQLANLRERVESLENCAWPLSGQTGSGQIGGPREDAFPLREGPKVMNPDNHPLKGVFGFERALQLMKIGRVCQRIEWNCVATRLWFEPPEHVGECPFTQETELEDGDKSACKYKPTLADIVAEDWVVCWDVSGSPMMNPHCGQGAAA